MPAERNQAFTLRLQSSDFHTHRRGAAQLIEQLLADNPFTTLQIVLEPTGDPAELSETLTTCCCDALLRAAMKCPTYLDRFYSVQPGRIKGAKRLIVVLPTVEPADEKWLSEISHYATIVRQQSDRILPEAELATIEKD